jgi:hypothetical protein
VSVNKLSASWLLAIAAAACGGTTQPSSPQLQVGGSYDISKTTTSDTCQSVINPPFSNPGTVTHSPGASSFVLNDHGTRDLPGRVNSDGTATISPSNSLVMGTIAATDTFASARFTATALDVTVTTDLADNPVQPGAGPCRIVTTWHAVKQGAPNVIPG